MQQLRKRGNVVILLIILIVVIVGAVLYLYKTGKLDGLLSKQSVVPVTANRQAPKEDELTKGDEVEDIEKDLNSTNLTETDKALGEVDKSLNNQ